MPTVKTILRNAIPQRRQVPLKYLYSRLRAVLESLAGRNQGDCNHPHCWERLMRGRFDELGRQEVLS